jgi:hypothetical protein
MGVAQDKGDFACLMNKEVFCGVHWNKRLLAGMVDKSHTAYE